MDLFDVPGFAMDDTPQEQAASPVLTVSELTACLSAVVDAHFSAVIVSGEVSNLTRAASGHHYFTLKDDDAQLRAVVWRTTAVRQKLTLEEGMHVIAAGRIEVYGPRGQYQLIISQISQQGVGAQEAALRRLHAKLAAEGLFEATRKRPLPTYPRRMVLVTSPTGAAVRDMLQVIRRRWPMVHVIVLPVLVQGPQAASQIAAALAQVGKLPAVDVVICGRGGGASEDLQAFNDERVVRAIAACAAPVISAVGHEIDVTLADLVADRRALTPTEAVELALPDRDELRSSLRRLREQLASQLTDRAQTARRDCDRLAQRRWIVRPLETIRRRQEGLDVLAERLARSIRQRSAKARQVVDRQSDALDALSPLRVVQRGYSLTKRAANGELVRTVAGLQPGDELSTFVGDGEILSRVVEVRGDDDA